MCGTNPERFAQFGVRVFHVEQRFGDAEYTAQKSIEAWENWCREIGMPVSLRELGVMPSDLQIEEMAEKCVATGKGQIGFFKALHKDDVVKILEMAK